MTGESTCTNMAGCRRVLSQFASKWREAVQKYIKFVEQGIGKESIWRHLNWQVFLGDDDFMQQMQQKAKIWQRI